MVRRTGANFFVLELSWSAAEPAPRKYRIDELARTARILRQSGAVLHLDLPLVTETARDVPADLAGVAFDDPKLSLRLGGLLDALRPALLDFQTLSLGDGADAYFADKPDELRAYRRLFDGAVQFLRKNSPQLLVGVTTAAPMDSTGPGGRGDPPPEEPAAPVRLRALQAGVAFRAPAPGRPRQGLVGARRERGRPPDRVSGRELFLVGLERLEPRAPGGVRAPPSGVSRRSPTGGRSCSSATWRCETPRTIDRRFRPTRPRPSGGAGRFSSTAACRSSTAGPSRRGAPGCGTPRL